MEDPIYLFFDSECVLCNNTVAFLLKKDRENSFIFVGLNTPFAQKALGNKVGEVKDSRSFLLLLEGRVYSESSAALMVGKFLPGIWKGSQIFWLVPAFIRNVFYRYVARNRYRWFGRLNSCQIATPENQHRFILK